MSKSVIEVKNLTKEYVMGDNIVRALRGVDLQIGGKQGAGFVAFSPFSFAKNCRSFTSWTPHHRGD